MKKPMTVCVTGLGHPEGPYELDDGRVIYANTYASEIGVYDPKTGKSGTFAFVGGGPNACMLGTDGCVYSTQTPNVGAWVAPEHRPPSIQKTRPDGKVEILVTEADGTEFHGPNDLTFAPDGRLWFTDSGDWNPADKPHPGRLICIEKDGTAHIVEELEYVYPNGIVAEPDGSIVWVEVLHAPRRPPDARRQEERHPHAARGPHPGRAEDRRRRQSLDHHGRLGRRRRDRARTARRSTSSRPAAPFSTACFGKGGALFCCDMGPFDVTGSAMTGRLVRVDVGVEGMPLFRGAIG